MTSSGSPLHPVRQLRKATGMTIRELELRTGINRGRLSIIERGVEPTLAERLKIEQALEEAEHGRHTEAAS